VSFVPGFGDESVAESVEEDWSVDSILRSDEIEESTSFTGSFDRREVYFTESIESETLCATDVVLAEMLEDGFGGLSRVDNERVKSSRSCRRDRNVVLVVDPSEVSETSLHNRVQHSVRNGSERRRRGGTYVESRKTTLLFQFENRGKYVSS
jgi:hypothetical protein